MRKNYLNVSINNFIAITPIRSSVNKLFLFLGLIMLSLNSFGQNNAADPIPFVTANFPNLTVGKSSDGVCVSIPIFGPFCGLNNEDSLIDASLTNFATARFGALSIGATHSLRVTDGNTTFPAGTFAGFKIAPSGGLLSLNLLKGVTIKTYNKGLEVDSFSGSSVLDLTLLPGSANNIVGFNSNKAFDAVEIVLDGGVSLLSSTDIYYAVIKQYSAGPTLECNAVTKLSFPTSPLTIDPVNTGFSGLLSLGSVANVANAISADNDDYATINFTLGALADASIAIKDQVTDYPAGTFAGFEIQNTGVLDVSALGNIVVSTYLDGQPVERFSADNLVANVSLLSSAGRFKLGFVSTQAFDQVKLTITGAVNLGLGTTRVYGAVFEKFCAGPDLVCNTVTKMTAPTFPIFINSANSGFSGLVSVGSVSNIENVVSANDNDYATINFLLAVASSGSIAIKDQVTDYPAGTYAGFEIENNGLLGLSALGNVVVATYLNGIETESYSGNNLVANVDLLPSGGRFKLGFVTTKLFDEVRLIINQTVGVSLGQTRVYGAVFQSFCAGPALECNAQTAVTAPTFPVYVNGANSGYTGLACVGCEIVNQDNLVDADLTNYAELNLLAGIGNTASLSVKDQITDYAAGTFAGYTIENPALLTVDALNSITIRTYLNGIVQETKRGNNGALVSVGTDLLVGKSKQTIGFVSTKPFDEVQITFQNLVSVNLGIVKVYNAVFQKLCDPIVECNENYVWSNPAFPVTIDGDKTGINGVACVACAVNGTDNLLTASKTDFANITLIAGVVGSGSVAVKDQLFTYPKGTFAGFVIKDLGTLAQVNLLQSLMITTYNNGVLQEARSAGQLIDLSLLGIDVLGSTPGVYNVGFKTTKPFDEIQLTLNSIASVINSINIYGAFVNTSESDDGGSGSLNCNSSAIVLTKDGVYVDANSDGIVNIGDRIDYTFDIKNTGFRTLTNVTLTDNHATVSGSPITNLAAGENNTTAYTATYDITQADIDAGVVYNLATVTAVTNLGTAISTTSTDPTPCTTCPVNPTCIDCTATIVPQTTAIALMKTAVVSGSAVLGDIITYTFTVKNTGNTTLTNIVVTDPMVGLNVTGSPIASLAPGVTNTSIKGTYAITQADVDAGKVTNQAKVTAKDSQNNDVIDISGISLETDEATETLITQNNKIALVKTASLLGNGVSGDTINYTFAVTNTGNTTLTNIVVTDPLIGVAVTGNPIATLAPGMTNISIKGTYVITQADVDLGRVTNSALVTAQDPQNNDVTDISGTTITNDNETVTPVGQRSTIALVKTVNAAVTRLLGETITYTFEVTNTGTTTLTNIVVTDPLIGVAVTGNPIATLAPGVTDSSITGTYVITQADVDAGKVTNSAKVTAEDPSGNTVTDVSGTTTGTDDDTITEVTQSPKIALMKTAIIGGTGNGILGEVITYTFTVKNTGNVTLSNVVITDPMVGLTITGSPVTSIAPGDTKSVTGAYSITQTDIIAGKVTNQAKVVAKDPKNNNITDTSGTTLETSDPTETPVTQTPSVSITKDGIYVDVNNDGITNIGDRIDYSFVVANTGESSLSNIIVTDNNATVAGSPIATLAYGASDSTVTATYNITQADIDAGVVYNLATVTAQPPVGSDVTATSTDPTPCITCPVVPGCVDCTITELTQSPKIALIKTAIIGGTGNGILGDEITYTFTVKNTGNVTLSNIVVTDPMVGLNITGSPIASLASGATDNSIVGTYTISQKDIDLGKVINSALVTAKDPSDNAVTDVSGTTIDTDDNTETPVTPKSASIALMKTAIIGGTGNGILGEIITYTFTVKNTGNVTLSNVVITDPMVGLTITGSSIMSIAPGETKSAVGTYVITQADIIAGKVTNSALVIAKDPQGINITDRSGTTLETNDPTETPVTQTPSIRITKDGTYVDVNNDGIANIGDRIDYSFVVANTGESSLSNIIVTDNNATVAGSPIATLAYGASDSTVTATYSITQSDIDAGAVYNLATVTAKPPVGSDVTATSTDPTPCITCPVVPGCVDCTITQLTQKPSIALVKTAEYKGDATKAKVGDKITYTFTVTNTGNVTVKNILISDAKLGTTSLALVPSILTPLASGVVTQEYTIIQADIDAKKVTNTAIAKGQDPQGVDVQDISGTAVDNDDPTVTDFPENVKIALILKGEFQDENNDGQAQIGETILYSYTIMNMGEVPLSNVYINDSMVGLSMSSGTTNIAVGGTDNTTFSASYSITQADIVSGNVSSQATVYGTSPLGVIVQDLSHDTSPLEDVITVIGIDGCQLTIFNAVSPNSGSDYEKILYIRGLDCYPDNTVQIFDRWGVKVYEVNGYDNKAKAFRGISEGRVTVAQSKGLANGTYFYVINYVDNDGKGYNISGYLHLIND